MNKTKVIFFRSCPECEGFKYDLEVVNYITCPYCRKGTLAKYVVVVK